MTTAMVIAREFHETSYNLGYSAWHWEMLPLPERTRMTEVVADLLGREVIQPYKSVAEFEAARDG